jgi:hypothetical protein
MIAFTPFHLAPSFDIGHRSPSIHFMLQMHINVY